MKRLFLILATSIFAITGVAFCSEITVDVNIPVPLPIYETAELGKNLSLAQILLGRIRTSPFNLVATLIFILAIVHTFFASKISKYAKQLQRNFPAKPENENKPCFFAEICHFLGEVEVIFGIWCVPLVMVITHYFGWAGVTSYFNHGVNFAEPIFVVVIMSMASTKPIITLAESVLGSVAKIGNYSPGA
jgi:hypothetical protein